MSWIQAGIAAGDIALLIAVTLVGLAAGWRLMDEVLAIARQVKQTYTDSTWTRTEVRWDERTGKKEVVLGRDVSERTREDVDLARSGAIALGVAFGLVMLGLLLFFGDVWTALNSSVPPAVE